LSDVILNLCKGLVFGLIVSAVGCLRGLQTREGPSAVGVSTTRAVVTSILLIVIADAVFSVIYYDLMK
jgi:phospholipid/cholesterol/gamma-HCH transport system permease protein